MAQQKKTATKKTGTTRGGSSAKSNTKSRASRTAQKQPRRREIGAVICLFLAVFSALGYIGSEGVFIRFLSGFMRGLIGFGYYFLPPAFLLAAGILAFHRGRPVAARVTATLLTPVAIGALHHLFACQNVYSLADFGKMWTDGGVLASGGVVSGYLTGLFSYLFSKVGAGILLVIGLLLLLFAALHQTVSYLIRKYRARPRLAYEPEPEPEPAPAAPAKPSRRAIKEAEARAAAQKAENLRIIRHVIDIPMDDDAVRSVYEKEPEKKKKPSFFNSKPRSRTPDMVYSAPAPAAPETLSPEEPVDEPAAYEPQPPMPIGKTAPADEAVPADKTEPAPAAPVHVPKQETPETEKTEKPAFDPSEIRAEPAERITYVFPPLSLLNAGSVGGQGDAAEEVRFNRERLEATLESFGIHSAISGIVQGPTVTRYEMELEAGVKLNKITNLADDIALSLGASGVRIAAIPNKISTVGIEVPNKHIRTVYLREIIDSDAFRNSASKLTFALGKDISGDSIVGNISRLPHLLVAGTTGSGKSVCLNSLILSILYKSTPDEVRFIMVDPKMVEFRIYNGIPHLLVPVVTEAKKAAGALQWAVTEMMKRYRLFSESGARDITAYNEYVRKTDNPELKSLYNIVVIIDELADLMLVAAKEVEEAICRVAQMGRAAGVHLVIATQSPRADVITGLMKANIPSRIALKVSSSLESRIILDAGGNAEKLVGNGDMLYAPTGTSKPLRLQGTWVSDEERERIVAFIKQSGEAQYSDDVMYQIDKAAEEKPANGKTEAKPEASDDLDELYPQAVEIILESGQASVSMLQRRLKLGYSRAARLVDQMEEHGIVGPFEGSKPRQLLITKQQWQEMQYVNGTAPIDRISSDMPPVMSGADDLFDEDE